MKDAKSDIVDDNLRMFLVLLRTADPRAERGPLKGTREALM